MSDIIINCETGDVSYHTPPAPVPDVDAAWLVLRQQRNQLLSESDWTVLADTPTSTAAWKAYRQQLRDLPANTLDPLNVVWPTPPA